jgi:hypothetical protein
VCLRECWYCEVACDDAGHYFLYGSPPGEAEARALDQGCRVYGILDLRFDEQRRVIEVEYDGLRLNESDIAALLPGAGFQLRGMIRAAL